MQILPAIDLRGGHCVRLKQGDYAQETIFGDDPGLMAARWEAAGAKRLHLVDLDGAKAGQPSNVAALRAIQAVVKIPFQVGGGIRDEASLKIILEDLGADRAIIGTQALKQPDWFRQMVQRYPGRVALGLDARDGFVATGGWLNVSRTLALELAEQFRGLPIAALIYTNIANDGMMQGIDDGTINDMLSLTLLGFPVIASGGVSTLDDVRKLRAIHEDHPLLVGAIIGRAIYEGTINVEEAVAVAEGRIS